MKNKHIAKERRGEREEGDRKGLRTGRGWRCGTAEQRVVQEDGAGAKMSVQVKLFIALHHGPFYQALITTSIIPLFPLCSYSAHIQEHIYLRIVSYQSILGQ